MTYKDINNRFTQIVAEYIAKGYTFNTSSMGGSQGEIANIDLTNGTEIIRIVVSSFSNWRENLEGVEIAIGRCTDNVRPTPVSSTKPCGTPTLRSSTPSTSTRSAAMTTSTVPVKKPKLQERSGTPGTHSGSFPAPNTSPATKQRPSQNGLSVTSSATSGSTPLRSRSPRAATATV